MAKIKATIDQVMEHDTGRCRACGAEAYHVEPDARNYECENCGATEVFGLEELLVMGELKIIEDEE